MFVAPADDPRGQDGYRGERAVLAGYLGDYRKTLELKCAGLDAEQLARRSVEPSTMSLLGLIRHLAGVEHYWFRIHMAGENVSRLYRSGDDRDEDFNGAVGDPVVVDEAWATWRTEVAYAEQYVEAAPSMDFVGAKGDELRDILVHMIEEYARHMGHADLLRERIDGRVGQ
ncbi:MAG: DinB family protein [Hamadaea sp.]|nr:DinB family protein [Hamadaea sp.]NUT18090.1 DinB family protein [Hamadaea sp.]